MENTEVFMVRNGIKPQAPLFQINDSRFGNRIVGDGKFAELIETQFNLYCKKYRLNETKMEMNTKDFRRLGNRQLVLF